MGKWQWPNVCFPQHFKKCIPGLAIALFFTTVLNIVPAKADDAGAKDISGTTAFDGTYVIHLSESARAGASGRPEPGYFDNLAIELFTQSGLDIELVPQMPWKRQMEIADREAGHVIYPTTRVDYREDVFKWVGPVSRTIWKLYGFENKGWPDIAFETLLRDARIGVLLGSAREAYLRMRGAEQLVMVPREELLLPMMMADRVDLIAIGGNILRHYIDQARSENPDTPVPDVAGALPYRTCYLYIAISGDVPDRDIAKLQTRLDTFKTNGFFVENRRQNGLSTNLESSFLKAMLDLDNNGVSCVDLNGIGP
ncbi:ABC transporter substrate-binding protein [Thalassospira sp.]|uniref:ABC transporter substrate-binding protein n=1 Tax=Thalassospira sp. TaxID=1912094 RepID=UPI001B1EB8D1|nr:ABC transporter substrate-binding protein [Thalassospira sp.]MBO6806577.1 ABC transporter substrate-binding protein [Thalassospira sp.]MBO6838902.1 ABC transporter substrate-binding protein [Thalassospira sp.]